VTTTIAVLPSVPSGPMRVATWAPGAARRELMTRPEAMICLVMSQARLNGVAKPMPRA
jgi:hypothetical protein